MAWKQKLAEIYVAITTKLKPLEAGLTKAKAMVKRGLDSMTRMAKRGAKLLGVALAAAFYFVTRAAMAQEDAEIDLAAALRETGDATKENIDRLKAYAAELQKVTTYGDEEILAQMAYAKNLGVTTAQLEEAAKAAIGLAAKYKLDLRAAMMLVGRASQGQTESLTRYGIVLQEGLSDQGKFNAILKIGADAFSLAEERAKGFRGALTRLWNVIGDVAERIGKPLIERLKDVAEKMLAWVKVNEELIATKVSEWVDKLVAAVESLIKVLVPLAKHWKAVLWTTGGVLLSVVIAKVATALLAVVAAVHVLALATGVLAKTAAVILGIILAKILAVAAAIAYVGYNIYRVIAAWKKYREEQKLVEDWEDPKSKLRKDLEENRRKAREAIRKQKEKEAAEAIAAEQKLGFEEERRERGRAEAAEKLAELEREAAIETDRLLKEKLERERDFYEEMEGYEEQLARTRTRLMIERAAEIAAALGITKAEAEAGLIARRAKEQAEAGGLKEAAERARIGFVGFGEAWKQMAQQFTRRDTTAEKQLKVQEEQLKQQEILVEEVRSIKAEGGGIID